MAINRAIEALVQAGLAEMTLDGVRSIQEQAEFVEKTLPFLADPVKERFFVTASDFETHIEGILPQTYFGVDALAYAPYIAESKRIAGFDNTYAFDKKVLKDIPKAIKMPRRYDKTDVEI